MKASIYIVQGLFPSYPQQYWRVILKAIPHNTISGCPRSWAYWPTDGIDKQHSHIGKRVHEIHVPLQSNFSKIPLVPSDIPDQDVSSSSIYNRFTLYPFLY